MLSVADGEVPEKNGPRLPNAEVIHLLEIRVFSIYRKYVYFDLSKMRVFRPIDLTSKTKRSAMLDFDPHVPL